MELVQKKRGKDSLIFLFQSSLFLKKEMGLVERLFIT